MTERQYKAKIAEIENKIKTLHREMGVLNEEMRQCAKTGEYSKINEKTELFFAKSNESFVLMTERRALPMAQLSILKPAVQTAPMALPGVTISFVISLI